ncbi:MAG: hypothetical protein ACUZ8O_04565 [Candidatus Anammoxibacter sp.]
MIKLTPIIVGVLVSGVISILGAPVFGYLWEPLNPTSTVFPIMAIAIWFSKKRKEEFLMLLVIIAGIFFIDFLMNKFYANTSTENVSMILIPGSLLILALTVSIIPVIGLLKREDGKVIIFYSCIMALVIFVYGIIYGGITPGVSDGPKLAAIVSIILLRLKKEREFAALWIALFAMGVLGNFIIPAISLIGVMGETF